ncbi:MAG: site-2 protease family protein [Myxococcales bacterium]
MRIHWSLLLILPYLAVVIGYQFRQAARLAGVPAERLSIGPYVWGLGLAVALFACVLLHELSHIAVGLRAGAKVHDVTLMMLGGVTNLTELPRGPLSEGLMALAGPVSSGLLAAICLLGQRALPAQAHDLRFGIFYLGEINLVLALFNIIPAFPMDGGRILRAALQPALGRVRATRAAALVGRGLAIALGLLGIYGGNFVLILIAVFVFLGAGGEARQVEMDDLVRRFRVGQVMDRHPPMVDPAATVGEVADRILTSGSPQLFIVGRDGDLVGIVTATAALRPGQERDLPVTAIAEPPGVIATPDEGLDGALRVLAQSRHPRLAVVEDGRLVGSLGPGAVEDLWRGRQLERRATALHHRREA